MWFGIGFSTLFKQLFDAFLNMRAAVVATPLLFTDVRGTSIKYWSVTTLALNRHYYFIYLLFSALAFGTPGLFFQ